MDADLPIGWIFASLLLSLRIAPVFAFAPPFSLTRAPALFRALVGVGLAASMAGFDPAVAAIPKMSLARLVSASIGELALGVIFVLALQLMFAALNVAGRVLDVQAGFGLAMVINPSTGEQTPLIGTLMAYSAGAVFFSMNGHADLLRILRASIDAIPIGAGPGPESLAHLTTFMSVIFLAAFGVAGGAILCLFLADMAIALLSRTIPQMNVLILGLQVKTLLVLTLLPVTFGFAGVLLVRMVAITLRALPGLL